MSTTLTPTSTPQEVRAEWVAALRSGEFEQGRSVLRTKDTRYCCLGVVCELAVEAGVIGPARLPTAAHDVSDYGWVYGHEQDNSDVGLPNIVRQWVGLTYGDGMYASPDPEDRRQSLAGDNDGGKSFEEIAAIIEAAPDGLIED